MFIPKAIFSFLAVAIFSSLNANMAVISADSIIEKSAGALALVVPNPNTCGYETGDLNKMEVTRCISQPCLLIPSTLVEIVPTFTPSYTSTNLTFHAHFTSIFGTHLLVDAHINGTFERDHEHRVSQNVTIPIEMAGKCGKIVLFLSDDNDRHITRCFDVTVPRLEGAEDVNSGFDDAKKSLCF